MQLISPPTAVRVRAKLSDPQGSPGSPQVPLSRPELAIHVWGLRASAAPGCKAHNPSAITAQNAEFHFMVSPLVDPTEQLTKRGILA